MMNRNESFKRKFLTGLAQPGTREHHVQVWTLEFTYNVPVAHVCELLIRWASEGLIEIRAYDGSEVRSWRDWESADALFYNTTDHGFVRVSLLAEGGAYVDDLSADEKRQPIGFIAT